LGENLRQNGATANVTGALTERLQKIVENPGDTLFHVLLRSELQHQLPHDTWL